MHTDQSIPHLIIRVFTGEASNEERTEIETWLNLKPENQKLFDELKDIWLISGNACNLDDNLVNEAIRKFRQKVFLQQKRPDKKKFIYPLISYAAILLLAIMIPASYFIGKDSASASDTYSTISCALGDKTSIVLPDSSQVFLNSGSKLAFNNNFKSGSRNVFLEGEAFFKVRKDPRNPFRVKTAVLNVEVLGTEFNLKAYSDELTIATTLVTGSLKVTENNTSITIKPNNKLIFDKKTQEMKLIEISDFLPETEWKDGRLVFRNQSLGELEQKLERWFDVEIEFSDDLVKTRRFTGTLEHESILEVVSYFGHSKYVAYKIKDNVITFFTHKKNSL